MTRTTNLPANGQVIQEVTNAFKYLLFRYVSGPCQYSFDGVQWLTPSLNDNLGPIKPEPTRIYFRATAAIPVIITFDYSEVSMVAQGVDSRVMSTRAVGTYIPSGFVLGQIFPGVNAGNRRKSIYFSCTIPNVSIAIHDASVNLCAVVSSVAPYHEETDSTFSVYWLAGAAADLAVCEIYYNQ